MSALKPTVEPTSLRTTGDSTTREPPGGTSYDPITFEQEGTRDSLCERWANLVMSPEGDGDMSSRDPREAITIDALNL